MLRGYDIYDMPAMVRGFEPPPPDHELELAAHKLALSQQQRFGLTAEISRMQHVGAESQTDLARQLASARLQLNSHLEQQTALLRKRRVEGTEPQRVEGGKSSKKGKRQEKGSSLCKSKAQTSATEAERVVGAKTSK